MSSWQDTFGKSDGAESNLQYDDGAFHYFATCVMTVILIPLIISTFRQYNQSGDFNYQCYSSICKESIKKYSKKKKLEWLTFGFITKVVSILLLLFLLSESLEGINNTKQIKTFDPYEILEVEFNASPADIKRAYRKLTLKYHPDKNKDDVQATAKFIMISKAYECLTDEKAMAICKKFGNPDGPGTFNVSIALPSFLLNKKNHVAVLAIFFLIVLIVVPLIVIFWYREVSKYDTDGIRIENKRRYYQLINENLILQSCPEIVSFSEELIDIPVKTNQEALAIKKISDEVISVISKPKLNPKQQKSLLLLTAFMKGIEIPTIFDEDMANILRVAPKLVDGMIDLAQQFRNRKPPQFKQKFMGLQCLLTLIEFKQMVVQGLWDKESSLLQLQFFYEMSIEKRQRVLKKLPALLKDLIKRDESELDNILNGFEEHEKQEIKKQLQYFPNLKVTQISEVPYEKGIQEGDMVHLKINLNRLNLKNDKDIAGPVQSIKMPYKLDETWHVIISDVNDTLVVYYNHVTSLKKNIEIKVPFPATRSGTINWILRVKSGNYRGLDHQEDLFITIQKEGTIKREVFVHEEDQRLDREMSLYQQLMASMNGQDSDNELEDDNQHQEEEEEELVDMQKKNE